MCAGFLAVVRARDSVVLHIMADTPVSKGQRHRLEPAEGPTTLQLEDPGSGESKLPNCHESEGITTVGQLCGRTSDNLLEIRNFGESVLIEVRNRLAQHGLHLCGEA